MKLPVDQILPEVLSTLATQDALVVTAPPGSGKTTRIPPALLEQVPGTLLLLQPRRAAARMVARRMAAERNERVGDTIGYQVRFDKRVGPSTRIEVLTEGILLRRLQQDPFLQGVGAVLFDEFHERSLHGDLALALVREVQTEVRPDLKIVLLSATLDPAPLLSWFKGDATHIHAPGRTFPVAIEHVAQGLDRPVEEQVCDAIRRVSKTWDGGHILAFLPGVREINRCMTRLQNLSKFEVLALHGRLTAKEQDYALQPSSRPRVVLATNLAETSVTLPDVRVVIDSGLHRIAYSRNGSTHLKTERISRDSADQRAGRAGRTTEGRAIRLWNTFMHQRLDPQRTSEIQRVDLCNALLQIYGWGAHPDHFRWYEPPSASRLEDAHATLRAIQALDGDRISALGRQLLTVPLHPRLGCILIKAKDLGVATAAAALCAQLSEGGAISSASALDETIEAIMAGNSHPRVHRVFRQICGLIGAHDTRRDWPVESLSRAVIAGFPDQVGKVRDDGERILLANGVEVRSARNAQWTEPWLVALEISQKDRETRYLRAALPIRPEWLEVEIRTVHRFDASSEAVRATRERRYGALVITSQNAPVELHECYPLLLAAAKSRPEKVFRVSPQARRLLARVRYTRKTRPQSVPIEDWTDLLDDLCLGKKSFEELRTTDLFRVLSEQLPWETRSLLAKTAPESFALPTGSQVALEYADSGPPILRARIQQLFGVETTPLVGGEPVLVQLLAPNNRVQQQTTDLTTFWAETYPIIRKELRGRYPKHAWPEKPTAADAQDRPRRRKR